MGRRQLATHDRRHFHPTMWHDTLPTATATTMLATTCSTSSSMAVPTTLRPGIWTDQVAKYDAWSDPPRLCPSSHACLTCSVSHLFELVSLGATLEDRAYASSGLSNPLAKRSHEWPSSVRTRRPVEDGRIGCCTSGAHTSDSSDRDYRMWTRGRGGCYRCGWSVGVDARTHGRLCNCVEAGVPIHQHDDD